MKIKNITVSRRTLKLTKELITFYKKNTHEFHDHEFKIYRSLMIDIYGDDVHEKMKKLSEG